MSNLTKDVWYPLKDNEYIEGDQVNLTYLKLCKEDKIKLHPHYIDEIEKELLEKQDDCLRIK